MAQRRKALCVIATTYVDSHGDKLTKSALERLTAESLPLIYWNHRVAFPPVAEVNRTWVEELPDGEYRLLAEISFFSDEDMILLDASDIAGVSAADAEALALECVTMPEHMKIFYDSRGFSPEEMTGLVEDCRDLVTTSVEPISRKSIDLTTVIIVGLSFLTLEYAKGFVGELGRETAQVVLGKARAYYRQLGETLATSLVRVELQHELIINLRIPGLEARIEATIMPSTPTNISAAFHGLPDLLAMVGALVERNPQHWFSTMAFIFNPERKCWEVNYLVRSKTGNIVYGPVHSESNHPLYQTFQTYRRESNGQDVTQLGFSIGTPRSFYDHWQGQ